MKSCDQFVVESNYGMRAVRREKRSLAVFERVCNRHQSSEELAIRIVRDALQWQGQQR